MVNEIEIFDEKLITMTQTWPCEPRYPSHFGGFLNALLNYRLDSLMNYNKFVITGVKHCWKYIHYFFDWLNRYVINKTRFRRWNFTFLLYRDWDKQLVVYNFNWTYLHFRIDPVFSYLESPICRRKNPGITWKWLNLEVDIHTTSDSGRRFRSSLGEMLVYLLNYVRFVYWSGSILFLTRCQNHITGKMLWMVMLSYFLEKKVQFILLT